MWEQADSAADMPTRRPKLSQNPAVSTRPAAPLLADAVGTRDVSRSAMRGIGREGRCRKKVMILIEWVMLSTCCILSFIISSRRIAQTRVERYGKMPER
jgi:hypothetical protein